MTRTVIRPLGGLAEREACVALQERVWGPGFADRVPASVLMIALETGGIASGAFVGDRLVGFVFGITGLRDGRPVHWSDMLAVDPGYRGRGIGYRLKVHQRALLLERDVEMVRWTFDPLEARNAHLNLRRLGAVADAYRRDVYGRSDSPLHAGLGTDRLVAAWPIAASRVVERLGRDAGRLERDGGRTERGGAAASLTPGVGSADEPGDRPVLNPPAAGGSARPDTPPRPPAAVREPSGPVVRIAIPSDIQALKRADLAMAVEWRETVREAFERALDAGYAAVDLERGERGSDEESVAFYVLARGFSL